MIKMSYHILKLASMLFRVTSRPKLRMEGYISTRKVIILIEGGNTHNFIHESLVSTLGLPAQSTQILRVIVGNVSEIKCSQVCHNVIIQVQGHQFSVEFHVLPLGGVDLVLGVQWLKSLDPVLTDYMDLTMKFMNQGRIVELQGDREDVIHDVTHH